jgi:hypothetical protein
VTVSSRSFFTFVSLPYVSFFYHLVSILWLINILLCFVIYLYSFNKKLCRFECRNVVCRNFLLLYFGNISSFSSSFTIKLRNLLNKHCLQFLMNFNFIHKSLYCCLYITFSRPNFSEIFATISAFVIFFPYLLYCNHFFECANIWI